MTIETHVTFRKCSPSPRLEEDITRRAGKLARFYPRIVRCAVTVEQPHRRHRGGNWFHIRIALSLPGQDVVIDHEPKRVAGPRYGAVDGDLRLVEPDATGLHARVAVREAFEAARRRLQQHVQLLRGDVRGNGSPRRGEAGAAPA